MKPYSFRYLVWLLLAALLLSGCTAREKPLTTTAPTATEPPRTETTLPETTAAPKLESQVIYDVEGVKVTVTGLSDDWMGRKITLLVENNTDRNLALSGDVFAVNDITVPGYLYAEVAAGMKTNDALELYSDALETADIRQIATVRSGDIRLVDTDSFEVLDRVPLDLATDLAEGYQQGIDDTGEELYKEEGVTVIAQILSQELYGNTVQLLVKNETGRDIIVEAENISVNGFTLDAWLYDTILADTVRFCEMDLFSTGLEENNIEEIRQVSFSLRILDAGNLQTICQSERLEIHVQG